MRAKYTVIDVNRWPCQSCELKTQPQGTTAVSVALLNDIRSGNCQF